MRETFYQPISTKNTFIYQNRNSLYGWDAIYVQFYLNNDKIYVLVLDTRTCHEEGGVTRCRLTVQLKNPREKEGGTRALVPAVTRFVYLILYQ